MTKTLSLRAIDIPQLHRFGIGFDSMFDDLMRVTQAQSGTNYPPHNVIKTGDNTSVIEVAVAGFTEGEIEISVDKQILTIAGAIQRTEDDTHEYLHRGISRRDFRQSFTLADHVEVKNATVRDGILTVYLEREVPESARPKTIAITYSS
jgi:molecular chaperone IbpA